jgi:hypothetical protein
MVPAAMTGEPAAESWCQRVEITSELDRKAVEALYLEIRRLGRLHGVKITELRIERVPADEGRSSA